MGWGPRKSFSGSWTFVSYMQLPGICKLRTQFAEVLTRTRRSPVQVDHWDHCQINVGSWKEASVSWYMFLITEVLKESHKIEKVSSRRSGSTVEDKIHLVTLPWNTHRVMCTMSYYYMISCIQWLSRLWRGIET